MPDAHYVTSSRLILDGPSTLEPDRPGRYRLCERVSFYHLDIVGRNGKGEAVAHKLHGNDTYCARVEYRTDATVFAFKTFFAVGNIGELIDPGDPCPLRRRSVGGIEGPKQHDMICPETLARPNRARTVAFKVHRRRAMLTDHHSAQPRAHLPPPRGARRRIRAVAPSTISTCILTHRAAARSVSAVHIEASAIRRGSEER